jgi:EAL domain-containing protein (putative c-di-GMP-specific phosphodiesterase class I)
MYLSRFFADDTDAHGCLRCRDTDSPFPLDLQMAFQPIVDVERREIFAYEALVRGPRGQPAGWVLDQVQPEQLYRFDQTCRVLAIATAAELRLSTRLSINFAPNAVYEPASCIRLTLAAAERVGFPVERLMFELTEGERIADPKHALGILEYYARRGFTTAIDDFGAGFSGLALLAQFQPHILKLDMELVRDIDRLPAKQAIVESVAAMARRIGSRPLAEGVETRAELDCLRALGIDLFQGYLIARPALGALPVPDWSVLDRGTPAPTRHERPQPNG